ncbi:SDR family oxidoreductase [Marinobacter salinisoli]|uniref:SDR family oxidoreductase n=1 Tax=Marinobacter salinisoli TaxID=2769486 RepID=A0ABX7MVH0_9GAMM|nr:fatty acyl-CoA reductase [Marinobacter salinisoli]QSP95096.1 SDR family oxidoreductase [Marinobacter salinisoli]
MTPQPNQSSHPSSPAPSLTRTTLSGKRILLTGTTGFLGKVILEKLIRDVPDLGELVLLIRGNRKYPCAKARFHAEVATSSVFDRLRETEPARLNTFLDQRIQCVGGEITQPRFGMEQDDYQALTQSVDVVINSAASVNFREALDTALSINAMCLHNLADFAEDAGQIPVIQISTCYVNGYNRGSIAESVAPPTSGLIPRDANGHFAVESTLVTLRQQCDALKERITEPEALAEALTELGQREAHRYGWGDTYTFTKWLGEQILLNRLKGRTLTIVRPSVIESCLQGPRPGWIEGVKVTDAILLAYARGKVSLFPGRKAGVVDIIPADLVANAVILSVAEALREPGQSRIYQSCSGTQNPLIVRDYVPTICGEVKDNWQKYPHLTRKGPKKQMTLVNKHLFVALIQVLRGVFTVADRLRLRTANNKSKALEAVETTLKLTRIYSTYTSPNYVFSSDRLMALAAKMGEADQSLFPVDAALIDWHEYFTKIHVAGLNQYGLEERKVTPPRPAQTTTATEDVADTTPA